MSGFSAGWLAVRESYDQTARNPRLLNILQRWGERRPGTLHVADLGAGTGATLRALWPVFSQPQQWWLLDNDAALLEQAGSVLRIWAGSQHLRCETVPDGLMLDDRCRMAVRRIDLNREWLAVAWEQIDLVTASALMDLVSAEWLMPLVAQHRPACYFALTYDGLIRWRPALPEDDTVRRLVNQHQRRDKGFGPALGPTAVAVMAAAFTSASYRVRIGTSNWRLEPGDQAMQLALLEGWLGAAREMPCCPDLGPWAEHRRRLITAGRSWLTVGHQDLLAWK